MSLVAFAIRLVTGARPVLAGDPGADEQGDQGDQGGPEHPRTVLDLPDQAVYFANHSSHLDFLTIWAVLPGGLRRRTRPVAAADYWGGGWRGRVAHRVFRPLLVERGRTRPEPGRPRTSQVDLLVAALDAGDSLILFPEGTRGDGERIADFHAGLARVAAARPDVPLVPVALANLGRILPKGGIVPVPVLATATFLAPVARGADEDERAFLDRARAVIEAALAPTGSGSDEAVA